MNNRPAIPEPVKREVRQRCGFGCILCGYPLYEYHHMVAFAVVREHTATNITLLCDGHHKETTNGLLPQQKIYGANAHPYNVVNGSSSPYLLHYGNAPCEFIIGSTKITSSIATDRFDAMRIDDDTIMGFRCESGNVLVTLRWYDENDREILRITDNELEYLADLWDVEFIGKRLTVRRASGDIVAQILFEPSYKIIIERAKITHNGIGLLAVETLFLVLNTDSGFSNCGVTTNFRVGIAIGKIAAHTAFAMPVDDELRHKYISDEIIRQRIEFSKNPLGR